MKSFTTCTPQKRAQLIDFGLALRMEHSSSFMCPGGSYCGGEGSRNYLEGHGDLVSTRTFLVPLIGDIWSLIVAT